MPSADGDGKRKKGDKMRPDIVLYGREEVLLVDVSLMHPLTPSYVNKWRADNSDGEQRLIRAREQLKRTKYEKLAKKHEDGRVVPFVIDALGAFGTEAEALLQWLGDVAADNGVSKAAEFVRMAYAVVSCALQRGNYRLTESGLMRMRALLGGRINRAHRSLTAAGVHGTLRHRHSHTHT